jgi:hypothetical protein
MHALVIKADHNYADAQAKQPDRNGTKRAYLLIAKGGDNV